MAVGGPEGHVVAGVGDGERAQASSGVAVEGDGGPGVGVVGGLEAGAVAPGVGSDGGHHMLLSVRGSATTWMNWAEGLARVSLGRVRSISRASASRSPPARPSRSTRLVDRTNLPRYGQAMTGNRSP